MQMMRMRRMLEHRTSRRMEEEGLGSWECWKKENCLAKKLLGMQSPLTDSCGLESEQRSCEWEILADCH